MSGNIFFDCVFIFFICYGFVSFFYSVSDFLMRRYCKNAQKNFIVLPLVKETKNIECDIRCAISKSLNDKCALVILCDGLNVDEYTVLWRLTDSYDHILVTTPDELPQKIDEIEKVNGSI